MHQLGCCLAKQARHSKPHSVDMGIIKFTLAEFVGVVRGVVSQGANMKISGLENTNLSFWVCKL